MRFPIYEHLYHLNRNLHEAVEILERIGKSRGMKRKHFRAYQVEVEHLRAEACEVVTAEMNEIELEEAFRFWKQKHAHEKKMRDPDDVYLEVERREKERREQGLPSKLGILRGRPTRKIVSNTKKKRRPHIRRVTKHS